jgi:hypothetical protein
MEETTIAEELECKCEACFGSFRCSKCGCLDIGQSFKYCPMCGRKIEQFESHSTPAQEPSRQAGHDD